MMKILRAVAFAACFPAAAGAAPASPIIGVDSWPIANLQDVTQAWYFTGEALRDTAPWAAERPLFRPADMALALPALPALSAPPALPASIHVPPPVPEPPMASMLLVGVALIFLRMGRKEELFG